MTNVVLSLRNMQPLCAILDCEEAEAIAVTLNILHISFVIEEGPVSKLGLPLSPEEVERLDFGTHMITFFPSAVYRLMRIDACVLLLLRSCQGFQAGGQGRHYERERTCVGRDSMSPGRWPLARPHIHHGRHAEVCPVFPLPCGTVALWEGRERRNFLTLTILQGA